MQGEEGGGGEISQYVEAWVISPFGASGQKGDTGGNKDIKEGVRIQHDFISK